jgi:hypothetical protein
MPVNDQGIDGDAPSYPRRMSDLRCEREFKRTRPTKDIPCVVPGCAKKFRPSTAYRDFLDHYRQKHEGGK